jgi:hypothetical protein
LNSLGNPRRPFRATNSQTVVIQTQFTALNRLGLQPHRTEYLADLMEQLDEHAARKKVSKSAIVETAVASFLSPDGVERREAAFVRHLQ